jgi:hypothetical protein
MPKRAPPPRLPTSTEPGTGRPLSEGERALVAHVFGSALDPAPVLVHRAKWWMWQPAWIAMAPDGHLWFHPNGSDWSEDFSLEPLGRRGLFVHEMVHVWQRQQGIDLRFRRPPFARYRYLPLRPGRAFADYGLEQQAEIVREAYLLAEGWSLPGRPPIEAYLSLIPFASGLLALQRGKGISSPAR